jgi:hypothetical protein
MLELSTYREDINQFIDAKYFSQKYTMHRLCTFGLFALQKRSILKLIEGGIKFLLMENYSNVNSKL